MKYRCTACGHEFESAKKRVGCPACKKRKLEEVKEEKISKPSRRDQLDFTHTFIANPDEVGRDVYDEDGKLIGKKCRTEPVKAKPFQFIDLGKEVGKIKEDQQVKRKLKKGEFDRSPRREKTNKVQVTCEDCSKTFQVSPELWRSRWFCDRCIEAKGVK